jgi:hypothetical protein
MIEKKEIAAQISALMIEYGAKLDASVAMVRDHCSENELKEYRRVTGKIMGDMLLEIMNPLYQRHPDLKPPQLR